MISLDYFDSPSDKKQRKNLTSGMRNSAKKTYNFREAIYYYCWMDVDILRRGCIIFAPLIKEITNVFPFYDKTCNRIAGIALKIFRVNFLKKNTMGQIPATGYRGNINQSAIALCWLSEVENELSENGLTLESKLSNRGEARILNRFVDGFCRENNTVYQFHGCFYHGCSKCYDSNEFNTVLNEKFNTLNITNILNDFRKV